MRVIESFYVIGWISYFYLCGYFYDDEMVIWKVGLRLMFGNV